LWPACWRRSCAVRRPRDSALRAQAEQLKRQGLDVTIVEALPQLLAPVDPETASQLQRRLEAHGIQVHLNAPIRGFEPRSDAGVRGSDVLLGDGVRIGADIVILGLGVRADTPLAKEAGIALGARGAIVVDDQLRTSVPNVWAIGDAIEVANPILGGHWTVALAGPANRQGRLCADNICVGQNGHGPARGYKGTYGTSALRCFGLTVAWVGANERALQMADVKYGVVHVHPSSHASYYPGACPVSLKLLFRMGGGNDDGTILGAQAVAEDAADKAIDTIATALQAGQTVRDLVDLELCYCPQLGSAKSPVNIVAMAAENVLDKLVATAQRSELDKLGADAAVTLLDVRSDKLAELPADGSLIVTSCKAGQRGYYAARVLLQSGFSHVKNLDGAWMTAAASPLPPAAKCSESAPP
jgi:rhodanese-related sulfurtransferase